MADQVVLIEAGRIEQIGTPQAMLFRQPSGPLRRTVHRPAGDEPAGARDRRRGRRGRRLDGNEPFIAGAPAPACWPASAPRTSCSADRDGVPATVAAREYLGDRPITALPARHGAGSRFAPVARCAPKWASRVRLSWPADALHLFDGKTGRRLAPATARRNLRTDRLGRAATKIPEEVADETFVLRSLMIDRRGAGRGGRRPSPPARLRKDLVLLSGRRQRPADPDHRGPRRRFREGEPRHQGEARLFGQLRRDARQGAHRQQERPAAAGGGAGRLPTC